MYGHAIATAMAGLGIGQLDITDPASMIMDMPPVISASAPTKLSVGDKAHRAFNKTRLYRPNGKRECARRARQNSSKATA